MLAQKRKRIRLITQRLRLYYLVSIIMTLADAVLGEFYAGEDVGIVLAGGNPGAVTAAVDVTFDQIGKAEHHRHLNP